MATEEAQRPLDAERPARAADSTAERIYVAPQWKLMYWRFRKHKLAVISVFVLAAFYLGAIFCEFVAPYDPEFFTTRYTLAPPTPIHIMDAEGQLHLPFVYGVKRTRDPVTLRPTFVEDTSTRHALRLFVTGTPYKLWGFIPSQTRLFGIDIPPEEQTLFLMGADRLGRDIFSRMIYGSRISLSLGLVGVFLSLFLGVVLGGVSGYYGGVVDTIVQRTIEFVRSIPAIPLWMGLSAALPPN